MTARIWFVDLDNEGRLQLPAELRMRLGIDPGSELARVLSHHSVYIHPRSLDDPVSEGPLPAAF